MHILTTGVWFDSEFAGFEDWSNGVVSLLLYYTDVVLLFCSFTILMFLDLFELPLPTGSLELI